MAIGHGNRKIYRNLTVPDSFGYWLSGLIDGEGHFGIKKDKYYPIFVLSLRKDDFAVLQLIKDTIDIGQITHNKRTFRGNEKPGASFRVSSISECKTLAKLIDKYPLNSKKSRDFNLWKIAIMEHNRIGGPDVENLIILKSQIEEIRAYNEELYDLA